MKNTRTFYLKIFFVLVVKFSVYLNRHVFVMKFLDSISHYTFIKFVQSHFTTCQCALNMDEWQNE